MGRVVRATLMRVVCCGLVTAAGVSVAEAQAITFTVTNQTLHRIDRPVEGLVFHFPDFQGVSMSAIRLGDYKFLKDWETGQIHLYNLANDLGETQNLAAKMPQKATELHRKLMNYLEGADAEKAEDIHLDSLQQSREQKRQVEMQIRELLESDDPDGKNKWSNLNMRLGFLNDRIEKLQERLCRINESKQKKVK